MEKVNVAAELTAIREHFHPKVVATLNGQEVKLAKTLGEFIWHHHDDADEMFLVVKGRLRLEFRDRSITLGPGELLVVPKGVEHRPVAEEETEIMLFEPAGVRNTGNVDHPVLTVR
ncbi:MAG: cupin domain-containing protein [Gemmatimonadota bacterium]